MKRRTFLQANLTAAGQSELSSLADEEEGEQLVARSSGARKLIRTTTGLEPFSGPWNAKTAGHLLRRTMFGPKRLEIAVIVSGSLDAALNTLFANQPTPSDPIGPTGSTWVNSPYDSQNDNVYTQYLKAWWLGLMVNQGILIRERMVLFWHNHFVSESVDVQDSRYMYKQNVLFRLYALGNIKELVKQVS